MNCTAVSLTQVQCLIQYVSGDCCFFTIFPYSCPVRNQVTRITTFYNVNIHTCTLCSEKTLCLFYSASSKTSPESKCPELLANYCDLLLRKTSLSRKLLSDEVERKLKDVVRFCYENTMPFTMVYTMLSTHASYHSKNISIYEAN